MDLDHYKNLKSSHQGRSNEKSNIFFSLVELCFKAAQASAHAAKYIWMCEEITGKNDYLRKQDLRMQIAVFPF